MHSKNHTKILTVTTLILLLGISSTSLTQVEDKTEQKLEGKSMANPETPKDISKLDDLEREEHERILNLLRPQDCWAYIQTAKRLRKIKHCITVPEFARILKKVESLNLDPDDPNYATTHTMVYQYGFLALKEYADDPSQQKCRTDPNSAIYKILSPEFSYDNVSFFLVDIDQRGV
jgi:hypothetical protein